MPDLEKVNKMEDVQVLAIDVGEPRKVVQEYVDEHGFDLTYILDEDNSIAQQFYVSSFPTTYFVDEEGILLGSVPGMVTYEVLEELLEKIRNDEVNTN
jgi:thioredoxin-related protein